MDEIMDLELSVIPKSDSSSALESRINTVKLGIESHNSDAFHGFWNLEYDSLEPGTQDWNSGFK